MKYQKKSFWRRMILSAGIMIGIIVAEISVRADEIQLPDVVVTSSRLERPVDGTPGFVSIIRASDLSRYMSSISESLTLAAGTNPLSYGSAGSLTWSSLRGSTTDQVLTLLDGVRMNNAQGGGFNLGSMSSASIERIEVLRGGASALYGADAVGGVVNIITSRPTEEPRNHVGFSFGSWMTWTASAGRSQKTDWVDYRIDFTHEQSEGDFDLGRPFSYEDNDGNPVTKMENNAYRAENLFLKLGWDVGQLQLEVANDLHLGAKEVPGLIVPDNPFLHFPTPEAEQEDFRDISYVKGTWLGFFAPDAQMSARVHSNIQRRTYFDDVFITEEDKNIHTNNSLGAECKWDYPLNSFHLLSFAPEVRWEKVNSTQLHLHERTTLSLFAQDELSFLLSRITVVPALRYDYHNDFGGAFSPKLGVVVQPAAGLSLKGNAGRSFRAPSFDDLYWPADAWSHGNPDLEAETAWNFDAGPSYRLSEVGRVEISGFYNVVEDLIQWAAGSDGTWSPKNVGKARLWGLEAGITSQVSRILHAGINYTYLRTEDQSGTDLDGNNLIYRPEHRLSGTLEVEWKNVRTFYEVLVVGERDTDIYNSEENKLDSYAMINLGVGRVIKNRLNVSAKVKNLGNERFQDILGYPRPGREFLMNITAEF